MALVLFAVLARLAVWEQGKLERDGSDYDAGTQDKLDLLETDVSKSIVPTELFLLGFGELQLLFVDDVQD